MLAKILAVFVHGPEIHGAIPIAQEMDAAVPPHRLLAGARKIRGERLGFFASGELPDVLSGTALVAFGGASLRRLAREEQRPATRVVTALRSLAQRNDFDPVVGSDDG